MAITSIIAAVAITKLLQSKMAAHEREACPRFAYHLKAEIDSELFEQYRGTLPLPFEPGRHSPQQPSYFFFESAMAGLLTCLSNSACSEGEQSISRRSKSAGCNRKGNLTRAFQGFVYIVGSVLVSVSSRMSWFTRWNRSSTRKSPLCGRPTLSIQVLASSPTVCTTNVVSSSHLPIE